MPTDNPYPAPAPLVLVQMLRIHAWNDDIDDDSRKYHEWSADLIERLVDSLQQLYHQKEQLEGDNAHLFHLHYGPQKGGAA